MTSSHSLIYIMTQQPCNFVHLYSCFIESVEIDLPGWQCWDNIVLTFLHHLLYDGSWTQRWASNLIDTGRVINTKHGSIWKQVCSWSQNAVDTQIIVNTAVYKAQCLCRARTLCLLSGAADKFCFLLSAGNTPLHLAVMMGHKGESFLPPRVHVVYFGLCVLDPELRCIVFCCFWFSLFKHQLTFVTDHQTRLSKQDAHRGGCVYGFSVVKGRKKPLSFLFKLMGTKRMSEHFYQRGLDGYSRSKASRTDRRITASSKTNVFELAGIIIRWDERFHFQPPARPLLSFVKMKYFIGHPSHDFSFLWRKWINRRTKSTRMNHSCTGPFVGILFDFNFTRRCQHMLVKY